MQKNLDAALWPKNEGIVVVPQVRQKVYSGMKCWAKPFQRLYKIGFNYWSIICCRIMMLLLKPKKIASGLTAAEKVKDKIEKGKRPKNKGLVLGETEADVVDAVARVAPVTARRTQVGLFVVPGTAAQNTDFTIAVILLFPR